MDINQQKLQYFGTDGIRGTFGQLPMEPSFIASIALAISHYIHSKKTAEGPMVVIGKDTRASGNIIENILGQTFVESGIQVMTIGVVPTPITAYMTKKLGANLGVMITASHNPASDNGIKLFNSQGWKLEEPEEYLIESFLNNHISIKRPGGAIIEYTSSIKEYFTMLQTRLQLKPYLKEWKVVVDTAHGATTYTTPKLLKSMQATVIHIGSQPNGNNINDQVGSEYPKKMTETVLENGACLGIAHDGDGDRIIVCDETGNILDGDEVIGILALDLADQQKLNNNQVVVTIHSNLGLDHSLRKNNITTLRTAVGDKHVLQSMLSNDCNLGGESSGHIIIRDCLEAGDGLIAALSLIDCMQRQQKPLSLLRQSITLFPKLTSNIPIKHKKPLETWDKLQQAIRKSTDTLGSQGRVLVRYSGTESVIRLLVEGPDREKVQNELQILKAIILEDC